MSTFTTRQGYTIEDGTNTQEMIAINDIIKIDNLFPEYKSLIDSRQLNNNHVEALAIRDADQLPPIKVVTTTYKGSRYYCLIDGYHRSQAAIKRGENSVKATTVSYDKPEDILMDFFESNLKHGLTATKSTRTAYAIILHSLHPDMSLADIAKHVGMNKSSVSRGIKRHTRGEGETNQKAKQDDTAKQIVRTLDRFLTLLSSYGDSSQEIVDNFISDFYKAYEGDNEKTNKAKDTLANFLNISEAMLR